MIHATVADELAGKAGWGDRGIQRISRGHHFAFEIADVEEAARRLDEMQIKIADGPKTRPDGFLKSIYLGPRRASDRTFFSSKAVGNLVERSWASLVDLALTLRTEVLGIELSCDNKIISAGYDCSSIGKQGDGKFVDKELDQETVPFNAAQPRQPVFNLVQRNWFAVRETELHRISSAQDGALTAFFPLNH